MQTPTTTDAKAVELELERILRSRIFASSHRSQRFLRYVVERSIGDGSEPIKEYAIALDVFERDASYDPLIDATVRVEAGRLRSRLREYYADGGKHDPLVIDIPKGSYRATFCERHEEVAWAGAVRDAEGASSEIAVAGTGWKGHRWGIAVLCLVAVAAVAVGVWRWERPRTAVTGKAVIGLAVLPFANRTGDAGNDYLADGLTENLIRQFSEVARLKVMARSAVDRLAGKPVARALGVDDVLTGELSRNPDGRLVVNTELSKVKDGSVLKSQQYLPEQEDLRPVQADIFQDVIQSLKIELDARQAVDARRPLTSDFAAFQAFLRGETAARGTNAEGMHAAILDYEEAVRRDPNFGLAWVALAGNHLLLGLYFEPPREHMPVARRDAERALGIDSSLRQAHGTLGVIHLVYDWDYAAAAAELASADATQAAVTELACTSHLLEQTGRTRNAEETVNRMLTFDPQSSRLISEMGCINYYRGQYDDAIRFYGEALQSDPRSPLAYWGMGKSLTQKGRDKEAIEVLQRFKAVNGFEPPMITAELGYTEGALGDRQAAQRTIQQLQREAKVAYVDPYFVALIYLGLKQEDATYLWLDKAFAEHSSFLVSLASDPKWKGSRKDVRFQALLDRMTESGKTAASESASLVHSQ
jgi:TolB-like protein